MAPTQKRMLRSSKSTKALTTLLKDVTPEEPPPTEVVTVEDDEGDTGVTYFMDENGCYYYQKGQNIISLPTATVEDNVTFELPVQEDVGTAPTQVEMSEQESYQTLTLVPSKGANGEVSYVLVVQDETKPMNNVNDIKPKILNDVYNFKDDEDQKDNIEIEINDAGTPAPKKTRNHNKTGFTCNICNYTSHRRYLLVRHLKSHSEERPLKCRVCERGFKTAASLQNHTNMHNGVKPHLCKYCHVAFTTSGELVRHVRYKHTHEKPHKCTECDYASVELSKLRRHVRCHTGERPYQCPHCTYASPDTFKLKRHIRTHTGEKPYKCDMCNMCFSQSNSLKAHKLIHNVADKPVYACELCPAKCGRKTDLRIHVQKLHTSDKPLKCKRCGKTFPDRYSCKMHNKTHEGEKCYKCDLCPYASTALRHLNSHILKHTDEKPYACDDCDQSFRQKQLLRRHQNLYHNPNYVPKPPREKTHTCHECNRCFAHKGNLIRHLEIHDPESGHQERALALKLGRQKKVRYTDSESLKGMHLNSGGGQMLKLDSGDLKQGELVSVDDSQQYVVIEVIQLEDGSEQQVAVVAPDYLAMRDKDNIIQMEGIVEDDDEEDEGNEEEEQEEDMETKMAIHIQNQEKAAAERSIKLERDVNTCFGFEEDDEDDEVYEEQKVIFELV